MSEFNFTKGTRICKVVESQLQGENNTEVFVYDKNFRCCIHCSDKCTLKRPCCKECSKFLYHQHKTGELNLDQIYAELGREEDETSSNNAHLRLRGGRFQLIPTNNLNNPDTIYIAGAAGSGKSFYIAQYLQQFVKYYPKYRIYLFSQKDTDKHLDPFVTKRIPLDEMFVASELEASDFKNSMCIFDDIDVISDKKVNKATYDLVDKILEIGRSYQIFTILTMHLASNRDQTKRILNRSTHFVFFKKSSGHNVQYALKEYLNFNKKEIRNLMRYDTLSFCIFRSCPDIVMIQNELFFQNHLDN